jgi:hypothetical protein
LPRGFLPRQDSAELFHLEPELRERNDAGAVLFIPEKYALTKDVYGNHLLRPNCRFHGLALLGKPLPGGNVELVLVLEAAEQAATPA